MISPETWKAAQLQELIFWQNQKYDILADYRDWYLSFFGEFIFPRKKILEIGCGAVPNSILVAGAAEIWGIDTWMDKYQEIPNNQLSIINHPLNGNAEEMPQVPGNYFDLVLCLNVLDHSWNWPEIIKEASRVLISGGNLYLVVDLRKEDEVNSCHPTAIHTDDIDGVVQTAGFYVFKKEIRPLFHGRPAYYAILVKP